jgi:glycine/D-amino acid oxidase-like deaminating enzyme/bacterioferritin-associated ferredoxin
MPRLQNDSIRLQGSTFSVEFDGVMFAAVAGESIAATLAASGRLALKRDKNGTPRGIFCGMGACFDCQVSVNGGPAERACLTKVRPGMKINSLAYRAVLPTSGRCFNPDQTEMLECDVLVIGAGPAGISAAIQAAEAGASIIVVDERSEIGGNFFKQISSSYSFDSSRASDSQYRHGAALIEELLKTDARIISGRTAWGAFPAKAGMTEICLAGGTISSIIRTKQLILATGAIESVPAFPGWTLPGVMTTGAVQGLARAYRVAPGQRVLISGNGPLNLHLACELLNGGVDVVAVAESAPRAIPRRWLAAIGALTSAPNLVMRGMGYLGVLRKHGVPIHYGHHIMRADGDGRVRSGLIAKIGSDAVLLPDTEKKYDVDVVCVGYALHPSNQLARSLGCKHEFVTPGVLVPVRDADGQTDVAGVFVIGDGGVLGGAQVAMSEGRLAARAALRNLFDVGQRADARDRKSLRRQRRFQRNLWSMYASPAIAPALPDTPVCRCELVSLATIRSLIENDVQDLGSIKRLSRAGMGPCQGRYCQQQIAKILTDMTGCIPDTGEMFAPQLPVKPTLIKAVATEKPEWHGYRTVDLPTIEKVNNVSTSQATNTNVLVIGAGVIGISTALFLAREGVEVVMVDRDVANGQASGGNAGSLHLQLMSFDFSDDAGADKLPAASALPLQSMGARLWRDLEQEIGTGFELEFTGGLMVAENAHDFELLRKKAALERRCGTEVEILSRSDLREMSPMVADGMSGAAYCPGEGKVNPMLATPLLLAEALRSGATIREQTEVIDINYDNGKYLVTTNKGQISCRNVVNAAGAWTTQIASMIGVMLPVKAAPQQMIVTEPADPVIGQLMALAKRHLTMKQVANGNIIIGGGWSAGYESESNRAVTLRESIEGNLWVAQRLIPEIGLLQMIRSWAAMGVMIDGAPILGELPGHPGFFNAVAANGYTMGPILGQITAELIRSGQQITDTQPFSVDRFQ